MNDNHTSSGSTVLLRAASGRGVGWGHLARCTALAEAFAESGQRPVLIGGDGDIPWQTPSGCLVWNRVRRCALADDLENMTRLANELEAGAVVIDLPDRPGLWNERRRRLLAGLARVVPVRVAMEDISKVDDMDAELSVNGNVGADGDGRRRLAGPLFQPVRKVFASQSTPNVRREVKRVLVCLGGGRQAEPQDRIVRVLADRLPARIEIVLAAPPPERNCVVGRDGRAGPVIRWLDKPQDLPDVAKRCDLAVVSGGQLKYELAAQGIPSVVIPLAADQQRSCAAWARAGGVVVQIGDTQKLALTLMNLENDLAERTRLAAWGRELVDGRGGRRVAEHVLDLLFDRQTRLE